jgi:hypothetical protein
MRIAVSRKEIAQRTRELLRIGEYFTVQFFSFHL